ncbi:hypothetical protein GQ55_5G476200 [Panicum hallii var. hallii]|uniref:Uncharacterized protein n=1 Tax=Panicum hallii var. hallii TaxID=1504633 RepID=A0A2T7DR09_9POAL|nr:hypothetical protein GQ55_5G476200 [Panicum hallii var. hallii]
MDLLLRLALAVYRHGSMLVPVQNSVISLFSRHQFLIWYTKSSQTYVFSSQNRILFQAKIMINE